MRTLEEIKQNKHILNSGKAMFGFDAFIVKVMGNEYHVVASIEPKQEHISITLKTKKRIPTWEEMKAIKDIFFYDEEECYQVFPKKSEYVNIHPYCMHIWRNKNEEET